MKALSASTLDVIVLCVGMFCVTWGAINFSHDAVKNRELDVQIELARAIGKYARPSLSIEPGSEPDGRDEKRKEKL